MTRCAYCNAPLKDADSVAAGYGPECAKRHRRIDPKRKTYLDTLSRDQAMRAIFTRPMRRRR